MTKEAQSSKPGLHTQKGSSFYCPSAARAYTRIVEACSKPGAAGTISSPVTSIRGSQRPPQTLREDITEAAHCGDGQGKNPMAAEIPLLADSKPFSLEAGKGSGMVGAQDPHQGRCNVLSPCLDLENQGTALGDGASVAENLSNWDRLGGEETEGLLVSLLRMKRDDLDVVAALLDAKPMSSEIVARKLNSENEVSRISVEKDHHPPSGFIPETEASRAVCVCVDLGVDSCDGSKSYSGTNPSSPDVSDPQASFGGLHLSPASSNAGLPLGEMVEPMVKAAIEFSTLLARSFFQSFSLAILALLARLRVLVQQILLDVVSIFNMFSTTHGAQSTVLNFGGVEVVREYYPSDNDVIALDCVWETDKFVLLEKTNKSETMTQVHCAGGGLNAPLIPSNIKYQTIEAFLGDDDPGYQKKDADYSLEDLSVTRKDRSHATDASVNQFEGKDDIEDQEITPEKCSESVINASTSLFSSQNHQPESRSKVAFVSVGRPTPSLINKNAPLEKDGTGNSPKKTSNDREDPFFSLLTAGHMKDGLF